MALRVALSGFIVLVVAMGIGRFAFTPQVPLMIRDGELTLTSAGLVAAINYLGYLLGVVGCNARLKARRDPPLYGDYRRGGADAALIAGG